jgi:uncharacterized protein (DUF1697 family)
MKTTYISILRGINVSGQKLIKMDDLRKMYEISDFQNVTTYVQSGNVIFNGDDFERSDLEQKISQQIHKTFGFEVPVIVLTIDKLKRIIDNNPFLKDSNKEHSFLYVTFLSSKPDCIGKESIESKKQDEEAIYFSENAVYLYCPKGYGRTKITNNLLESKLKVVATTRNWNTTNELLKIANKIS